ncbi:hypothetical protein [Janthinobacterium sp. PC23-8]|uniref:hypothetical protein n=1 Tax=Janthinobacterium sp. PC23-8 TaxID=2012679 RepID=UPI000B96ED01|nr:hypothetical protein [Janthinobacterium sp. PC23-8]OYO31136.1 hypothetical protein CD932_08385 [Janthinobacterium sp. PC23-8]
MKSSCLRPLAALLLTVGLAACGGKASYDVSGTISGLNNAGLVLANGGDTVSPPVGATTFTFPQRIDYGTDYNITVKTPPAHMNCAVSGGTGSAGRYLSIQAAVNCQQNVYTVGGTISGQTVDGLVLGNGSTATPLTVAKATATFTMPTPVADGNSYGISVITHPAGQTCRVATNPATGLSSGVGTMGEANVTSVNIVCTTN